MSDRKTYAPGCDPESMRLRHRREAARTRAWAQEMGLGTRAPFWAEFNRAPWRSHKNIKQRAR